MNYMRRHILEAIALNRERLPLYAALTANASVGFSKALIRREQLALIPSLYFDLRAKQFQRKGIGIIEQEFVSMNAVRPFAARYPEGIDFRKPLVKLSHDQSNRAMAQANKRRDFQTVREISDTLIMSIGNQPHVYCMYRHLLESIRRCACFAPLHISLAEAMNYPPPVALSRQLIWLHLANLKRAQRFDEAIAFIQCTGVPFLFQDLPAIGLEPNTRVVK